ncbi:MAG: hypothetical protein JNL11_15055 [Bdellovibrionaceae bacterium]|nr:hypothetical protein [Pseudobdellovibrionaceae bacterium]
MTNDILPKKEGRMVVSPEAEAAVAELADAVNEGFDAGRATRFDVASFMILWFKEHAPQDVILEIRRRSANAFSMLDAVQKKYKAIGELPPDIQAVLDKHFFGEATRESKKIKKNLKQEYITDIHKESEESV